jgi:hypothetical protein
MGVKERILLKESPVRAKCTDWIQLAHDCPVNMFMNLWFPQKVGHFLINN